jgi:hypothetical protein
MEKDGIQKILQAAVRAPSGENCQPWRFILSGETLLQYNIPERDQSPYNFRQSGSFVSHGAVIENINIAASAAGYRTEVLLFPKHDEPDCVASITFIKDASVKADGLSESIFARASNRTNYDPSHQLDPSLKERLLAIGNAPTSGGRLEIVEDGKKKHEIAEAMSYGDRMLFANRTVHDFLFAHIYWGLDEAKEKSSGFYVKELALKPPQEFVFKLLKSETMRRFFGRIGLPGIAAKENVGLYEHSSALGCIIMPGSSPADFVGAGRILERIWLTATQAGYDIQLLTAVGFFMHRIQANEGDMFSPEQISGIVDAYKKAADEFGAGNETIAVMFRIGKGKPLPSRSFRMEPQIEYRS